MNWQKITTVLILLGSAQTVQADTVDNFTAPQGPITVGPGEEPPENEAAGFFDGILGGFRVMAPVVDEEAPAGSTATAGIGGGEFDCTIDFTVTSADYGGGCALSWSDDQQRLLDFSAAGAFEIEVIEAGPGTVLTVFILDGTVSPGQVIPTGELNGVINFLQNPAPGSYTLPIADFLNPVDPFFNFDLTSVTNVVLGTAFIEGTEGTIRLGSISTTGPVGRGETIDPPDEDLAAEDVNGTWFNPARDGEGCQLTLESDQTTIILSCYVFQDGEQAWFIGSGVYADGTVNFSPLVITTGGQFGDAFDTNDLVRSTWGAASLVLEDCNNATLALTPEAPGFEPFTLDLTKITQANCAGEGPSAAQLLPQGTLFDPARDGEGIQLSLQGDTNVYVMTWYTYVGGQQAWIVGSGTRTGDTLQFNDLIVTRGADFGSGFDPADVVRTPWGTVTLEFTDCNNALITADAFPGQPGFSDYEGQLQKIVGGICATP